MRNPSIDEIFTRLTAAKESESKISEEDAKQIFYYLQPHATQLKPNIVFKILVPKPWLPKAALPEHQLNPPLDKPSDEARKFIALILHCASGNDGFSIKDVATILLNSDSDGRVKDYVIAAACAVLPLNKLMEFYDYLAYEVANHELPLKTGSKGFLRGAEYASKVLIQIADKTCVEYTSSLVTMVVEYMSAKLKQLEEADLVNYALVVADIKVFKKTEKLSEKSQVFIQDVLSFLLGELIKKPDSVPPALKLLLFHSRSVMEYRAEELQHEPLNAGKKNNSVIASQLHGIFFLRCVSTVLTQPPQSIEISPECKTALVFIADNLQKKLVPKLMDGSPEVAELHNFLFAISEPTVCADQYLHISAPTDAKVSEYASAIYDEFSNEMANFLKPKARSRLITGPSLALSPGATRKNQAKDASPRGDFDQTTEDPTPRDNLNSARSLVKNSSENKPKTVTGTGETEEDTTDEESSVSGVVKSKSTGNTSPLASAISHVQKNDLTGAGSQHPKSYQTGGGHAEKDTAPSDDEDDIKSLKSIKRTCPPTRQQTRIGGHIIAGVLGAGTAVGFNPEVLKAMGTETSKGMAQALIDCGLGGPGGIIWVVMIAVIAACCAGLNEITYRKPCSPCPRGTTFSRENDEDNDGENTPLHRSVNDGNSKESKIV